MRSTVEVKDDLVSARIKKHELSAQVLESDRVLKLQEAAFLRKEIPVEKITKARADHTALVDTLHSIEDKEREFGVELENAAESETAAGVFFDQIRENAKSTEPVKTLAERFDGGETELNQRFGRA